MKQFAAGVSASLAAIALSTRELGRPILRLTEVGAARWHQRRELYADQGTTHYPHHRGVEYAQDKRGFECIPVIPKRPRQARAEHGWLYGIEGVALGVC